jgi:L-ribulokinase
LDAAGKMARLKDEIFKPIPENQKIYSILYSEYEKLYNYFGRGENDVMKTLKKLRAQK